MENTKISWCDYTFNSWIGCSPVSLGCDNCFAAAMTKRWGGDFSKRQRTSEAYWRKPLAWNRKAKRDGTRPRVLCGSMCDVFDCDADCYIDAVWRIDLRELITTTPNLQWLVLTKRPESCWLIPPPNAVVGITTENQEWFDHRMSIISKRMIDKVFISAEPLLGPLDISAYHDCISWIIIGCEKINGRPGRRMEWDWCRGLIAQGIRHGIPIFVKQMSIAGKITTDVADFPAVAQLREFPCYEVWKTK